MRHDDPSKDFTAGRTPVEMLERLKEFAVYGLDEECHEVNQLIAALKLLVDPKQFH